MYVKVSNCSSMFVPMYVIRYEILLIGACAVSKTFFGEVVQLCACNSVHILLLV